jgi:hypothetical protein
VAQEPSPIPTCADAAGKTSEWFPRVLGNWRNTLVSVVDAPPVAPKTNRMLLCTGAFTSVKVADHCFPSIVADIAAVIGSSTVAEGAETGSV